jgi:hypothetical protein
MAELKECTLWRVQRVPTRGVGAGDILGVPEKNLIYRLLKHFFYNNS